MASGDVVGLIVAVIPPGANYATEDVIVGAATPAESFPVWDFDDTTDEMIDFLVQLEGYDGGGLTFELYWAAAAATGNVVWQAAVRRIADDAEDIDTTAHSYDYNGSGAVAVPSAIGELGYDTITFTDGADMDSWADTEIAVVRVRRDADDTSATDSLTGDAMLAGIVIRET